MRTFIAIVVLFVNFASTATAAGAGNDNKTQAGPSIEAIKLDEDLHLCGGVSWSLRVTTLARVDQSQVEDLKLQASTLAGLKVEELIVGEAGEKYVTFVPTSVATEIPVMTGDKNFSVIELRIAKKPQIEQIKFFHDSNGVSSVVRFKSGTTTITQLESLLQIAKMTETQNAAATSCGAESCGTIGCTECRPSCGCQEPGQVGENSLVALTPGPRPVCDTCDSGCADCSNGQVLKMTQIDERTFSFERLQK